MAPRKTRNGASAATRRTASAGSGAASRSRTPSRSGRLRAVSARLADVIPLRPEFAAFASGGRRNTGARPARSAEKRSYWTLPLALLLMLAVFGAAYYPVVRVQYREYRDRARLRAELADLKSRNARLDAEVARLRTPEGVEDYARTRLGLVKRGEHVVIVSDESGPKRSTAATGVPEIDSDRADDGPAGPWTAFLDLVFGVQ